jgi:hypothetical protein
MPTIDEALRQTQDQARDEAAISRYRLVVDEPMLRRMSFVLDPGGLSYRRIRVTRACVPTRTTSTLNGSFSQMISRSRWEDPSRWIKRCITRPAIGCG